MWKMVSYEAQGRGHAVKGIPCQDKTAILRNNEVCCIALADGAGSAKLSHYGAEQVVKIINEYMVENFEKIIVHPNGVEVKQMIVGMLVEQLIELAKKLQCEIKDLACTLMFVAIKDQKFIIGHIGDGVIGYIKDQQVFVASSPENGEFVNSTFFVTSSKAVQLMKLLKGNIDQITGFVLMSDGSAESFYSKKSKTLSNVLTRVVKWTSVYTSDKMTQMLKESLEKIVIQNTHDDCSIAILARDFSSDLFETLSLQEKSELFKIQVLGKRKEKAIKQYENIIKGYSMGKNVNQISRCVHLKDKYIKRKILKLKRLGLLNY